MDGFVCISLLERATLQEPWNLEPGMWYIIFMHQDPSIHVSTVRIIDKSLLGPQFPKGHSSSHIACSGVSCFCIVARTPKIYNKAPRRTAVLGKHLNYMIWTLSYWEACHFHMNRTSLNIFSPKQRGTSIEFRWVFSELLGFAGRDWSGAWARDGGPGSFLKMLMNPNDMFWDSLGLLKLAWSFRIC